MSQKIAQAVSVEHLKTALERVKGLIQRHSEQIREMQEQAALNRSSIGLQRKNLLKNYGNPQIKNGITFTVNSDGTVAADGTAEEEVTFYIARTSTDGTSQFNLPAGRYIYSGCSGGSSSTYTLRYYNIDKNPTSVNVYNEEKIVEHVPSETCNCSIVIKKGATLINQKFSPMLRYADITDDTYEPYVPSLQEQIDSLTAQLDAAGITAANAAIPDTMMDQESFEMVGAVPETKE